MWKNDFEKLRKKNIRKLTGTYMAYGLCVYDYLCTGNQCVATKACVNGTRDEDTIRKVRSGWFLNEW